MTRPRVAGRASASLRFDVGGVPPGHVEAVAGELAERARLMVRRTDQVVRLGAGCFEVRCQALAGAEVVPVLADRLVHALGSPVMIGDGVATPTLQVEARTEAVPR
jgi:hypothetical protein